MSLIWYNEIQQSFEKGDTQSFQHEIAKSNTEAELRKLFEFNTTSIKLMDKILETLKAGSSINSSSNKHMI
jgi:hypothetical protein